MSKGSGSPVTGLASPNKHSKQCVHTRAEMPLTVSDTGGIFKCS